jgi:hypothetical protein
MIVIRLRIIPGPNTEKSMKAGVTGRIQLGGHV